jgi:hypothetical protein
MRRLTAAFLVGTIALSAAACSGSDSTKSLSEQRTAAKSKASTSTSLPFESDSQHTPGTLADFVGAKGDAHDVKCARQGAYWNATGKLTNPTQQAVKYRVYISFMSGDTTVGLTEFNSGRVAPKGTDVFHTGVKVQGTDLQCVLRVERADA